MNVYHIIANSNKVSGRGAKHLQTVKDVFTHAGREYQIHLTEYSGDAKTIAQKITESGEPCTLIAMGGDGTIHEVLNGIAYPDRCELGIIPIGTGNDFACGIGLPKNVKQCAQIVAFKAPRPIDYIQLSNGLRSINSVGMGLDCDILQRVYKGKYKGRAKYFFACIVCLLKFKTYHYTAEIDGVVSEHSGLITCLSNGTQFGGGIKLFPHAKVDDGLLDLIMVDYVSKPRAMFEFTKLMLGKLKNNDRITYTTAKKVKITPKHEEYVIQAEGELYQNEPFEAEIISDQLHFFLP